MARTSTQAPMRILIVGSGRAGGSFSIALSQVGLDVNLVSHTDPAVSDAAERYEAVLLCVPDANISEVAQAIRPGEGVVCHVAGSQTLSVLDPHPRRASLHPLMSLPDPQTGAARLLDACWFAVAGDPVVTNLVEAMGGLVATVADSDRALYHATAAIAANHLVALAGQVERLASAIGVPAAAYWKLMSTTMSNVANIDGASSVAEVLTGPAARGDWATIRSHLGVLGEHDRAAYLALAQQAASLAGNPWPADLGTRRGPPTGGDGTLLG